VTEVLRVDAETPDPAVVEHAASVLRAGGTVAFPTETVYGVGATALDASAVRRVFEAKGRPPEDPLIVHLAAEDGVQVELAPIVAAFARLRAQADIVVVEGVGGWLAPVSATLDQLDLVRALQLPVLLVVGMRLGCVNHARLTAQSLQASGVQCLGWIGNHIPLADAKWMGQLLAQLSPDQIRDAFRAAGYSPQEVDGFAKVIESRIAELNKL